MGVDKSTRKPSVPSRRLLWHGSGDRPAVRARLELDTNVLAALAEFLQGLGSDEHTVSLTSNGVASHAQVSLW